jgi:pyruvate ferredoxin oxidoreductase alpha subunit
MVYDSIIQAYKIAEDPRVHLPVMVVYDGYIMSHTVEPVEVFDKEDVLKYIPKNPTWIRLDPDNPVTMGTITSPDWYYEFKYQQVMAMRNALKVVEEADKKYGEMFGRSYGLIGKYMLEDADVVLVTMGAFVNTAAKAAVEAREKGIKAGVLELRLYRPFPVDEIAKALSNAKAVGIIDKAISYGAPQEGPVFNEFAGAFYSRDEKPLLVSFIAGIGQRAVFIKDFLDMFKKLDEVTKTGRAPLESIYIGVRK